MKGDGARSLVGLLALAAGLALAACSGGGPPAEPGDGDPPVAVSGGEVIRAGELDDPLRLQLYDLEEAAFALRWRRLQSLLQSRWGVQPAAADEALSRPGSHSLEILLAPPSRPRLALDVDGAPWRGATAAPVVLVVFCDYVSMPCRRLQPVLASLLARYADLLQQRHVDAPRAFHRGAVEAAVAARCAGEQGRFWSYHDALYADQASPGSRRLQVLAGLLGLDGEAFGRCLASGAGQRALQADAALTEGIGVRSVPVAFVNGLYVKGEATERTYADLIGAELARLGLTPPPPPAAATVWERLGLRLVATTVIGGGARSTATFAYRSLPGRYPVAVGGHVAYGYVLQSVAPDGAVVTGPDGGAIALQLASRRTAAGVAEPSAAPAAGAAAALPLPRDLVDRALRDPEALAAALKPGRLDVEGVRLLKLERVEPGSLYDWLGLQAGDVLMQVDGVFVHDQYNPLWDALRDHDALTLTIMRRGIPRTFQYRIEQPGEAGR